MGVRVFSSSLIGRDAELAAIAAALEQVLAKRGRAVLISGEAGIGKSRLLATALERARQAATILSGGCLGVANGALPLAPILEAIRPVSGTPTGVARAGELANADGWAWTTPAAELRPEWARGRLHEAFMDLLRSLATDRPVVLAIEDLHWADRSTLELLSHVIRAGCRDPVLVLATWRDDEVGDAHPLTSWLAEVRHHGTVEWLSLPRLGRTEITAQVTAILGAAADPAWLERLHARSDGNPLFVEELVAAGEVEVLPRTLRELLAGRLDRLPDRALRLAGVAALVGREADLGLLAAVAGLPDAMFEAALLDAVSGQILAVDVAGGSRVCRFRHALLAETAVEALLPGERRRVHALIAEALERDRPTEGQLDGGPAEAGRLAEIAHHWFEAHEHERAFEAAYRAGAAAMRAGAPAEGLVQLERVLFLWDRVPDPVGVTGGDRIDLLRRTGQAAQLAGRYPRAIELLGEAIAGATGSGDRIRSGLLEERLGRSLWSAGRFGEALDAYGRALEQVPALPVTEERTRVLAGFAQMLMLSGRFAGARAIAEPALEVARGAGLRQLEGHLLATLGAGLGYAGDPAAGVEQIRLSLAIAEETGDLDDLGRAYAALSSTLGFAGRHEEGAAAALEGAARLARHGMAATYGAFLRMNAADDLIALGRWDEALEHMRAVEHVARGASRMLVQQELAVLLALRGDIDGAEQALRSLEPLIGRDIEAQFTGPVSASRMMIARQTGDLAGGRAVADRALALLEQTDDLPRQLMVLDEAMRLEAAAAERARAERNPEAGAIAAERATRIQGLLGRLADQTPRGAATPMVERSRAFAAAEASRAVGHVDSAAWRRAIDACGADTPLHDVAYARCRHAEALLHDRSRREEAAVELAAAHRIALALGAVPLAAAIESAASRARLTLAGPRIGADVGTARPAETHPGLASLTAREVEILRLIVRGRTNRQIARELFLGLRTVGDEIARIRGALGVRSRGELAAVAVRLGIDRS